MALIVAPHIDRVKLVCAIPKALMNGVEKGYLQMCGKYCTYPDTFASAEYQMYKVSLFPNHGVDAMRVELYRCYGKRYLRYDFNPNNISIPDLRTFIKHTQYMGFGSYSHALIAGAIRELEIAVDVVSQHTSQYICYRPYVHGSDFKTDGKQEGGTYYLGSKDSDRYYAVYDKAEERHAKGLPYPYQMAMRIEARLQGQAIKVSEMADLPNPFMNLTVGDINLMKKDLSVQPAIRNSFIKLALKHGAPFALTKFSPKQKKALIAMIKACAAQWWKPNMVLENFAERALGQIQVAFAEDMVTT